MTGLGWTQQPVDVFRDLGIRGAVREDNRGGSALTVPDQIEPTFGRAAVFAGVGLVDDLVFDGIHLGIFTGPCFGHRPASFDDLASIETGIAITLLCIENSHPVVPCHHRRGVGLLRLQPHCRILVAGRCRLLGCHRQGGEDLLSLSELGRDHRRLVRLDQRQNVGLQRRGRPVHPQLNPCA